MRASCLMLTLIGCVGGANLGTERRVPQLDASTLAPDGDLLASDANDENLGFSVAVALSEPATQCGTCYDLLAQPSDTGGSYTFAWEDGSQAALRRVCPLDAPHAYSVTLSDSRGLSASTSVELTPRLSTCNDGGQPAQALLCLVNGSFESDGTRVPPLPATFASPWLACGTATPNFPQLYDDSNGLLMNGLGATDGATYLGLAITEQVSQSPCAPIAVGDTRSFMLDVAEETAGVANDMVGAALEIWGGTAVGCLPHEKLWTSPNLTSSWQTPCVTIAPTQPLDDLFLRAVSTGVLPYPGRVLVDHIQPVSACP